MPSCCACQAARATLPRFSLPSEISATVKAYTALKLAGLAYDDPNLARARDRILALGGLQAANSYVKVNLSLFNLYPREHTPHIPPEFMLLGKFIYEMSSWTRAIVIPLSVVHAMNPQRPVPAGFTLNELFLPGVPVEFPSNEGFFSWRNFFLKADKFVKLWERYGSPGLRTKAIRRAEKATEHRRIRGNNCLRRMHAAALRVDEGAFKMNPYDFGTGGGGNRLIVCTADITGNAFEAAVSFFERRGNSCGHNRGCAETSGARSDSIEGIQAGLHHIMPPGAVDVYVHKAGNNNPVRGMNLLRIYGDSYFCARSDRRNTPIFDENNCVGNLYLRREDAGGVQSEEAHGRIILLELTRKSTARVCFPAQVRYNASSNSGGS
jgi:hypothetical protein